MRQPIKDLEPLLASGRILPKSTVSLYDEFKEELERMANLGITILEPFKIIPLCRDSSSLKFQYGLSSGLQLDCLATPLILFLSTPSVGHLSLLI